MSDNPPSAQNVLDLSDLHVEIVQKHSVVRAVDGVSLQIRRGETLGLVGESGCGKTMTGMSIIRLLPPGGKIASGSIRLVGKEISTLSEKQMRAVRGNDAAVIFQDPMTSLNPTMTIGDQICEAVRSHRSVSPSEARARAIAVLTLVGMPQPEERLSAYPHLLSGGLRQRVVIAMALACDPQLLIADEPTTALDVTIQAQILGVLDSLKATLGMATLLITHDLGVIAGRADAVAVMYAGKIVEYAATGELFSSPQHPYTEALMNSIPRLDQPQEERLFSIPGLPPDLSQTLTGCRFAPRCRYATATCVATEPPLTGDLHKFACHYPLSASAAAGGAST